MNMPANTANAAAKNRRAKYRANFPTKIRMMSRRGGKTLVDALSERGKPVGDERWRFQNQTATDDVPPEADRSGHRQVLQRKHPWNCRAEYGGGKADKTQQRDSADRTEHGQCAALARCTWNA